VATPKRARRVILGRESRCDPQDDGLLPRSHAVATMVLTPEGLLARSMEKEQLRRRVAVALEARVPLPIWDAPFQSWDACAEGSPFFKPGLLHGVQILRQLSLRVCETD